MANYKVTFTEQTLVRSAHINSYVCLMFNVHGSVHCNNILIFNSNLTHKSQILFYLIIALHVSGVTITHPQEHKSTVTTASGNHYTVLLSAAVVEELELI
jgi:predicted nucleic acid-binding Zn ribbon protein